MVHVVIKNAHRRGQQEQSGDRVMINQYASRRSVFAQAFSLPETSLVRIGLGEGLHIDQRDVPKLTSDSILRPEQRTFAYAQSNEVIRIRSVGKSGKSRLAGFIKT